MDNGVGEDFGTTNVWLARGARVYILHPSESPRTLYTDVDTGCLSFLSNFGSGFEVRLHAETKVGGTGNITIRAFASLANLEYWEALPVQARLESWRWYDVAPTCDGTFCDLTLTNTSVTDVVSNLIAAATWVVHRVDSSTSPRIAGTHSLAVIHADCDIGSGSCYIKNSPNNRIFIQDTLTGLPEGATRKFLIGHETGHFFDHVYSGGLLAASGAWGLTDINHPRCSSAGVVGNHALRSEEWASGAFVEGFAHFISTLAFNQHTEQNGIFKYYKNDSGSGFSYNFDTVDVEGSSSWLHSTSGCDCRNGAFLCPDRSTELDWLRFFWDFRTNPGGTGDPQPTHADIFAMLAHVGANHLNYGLTQIFQWLDDAVPSTLQTRFTDYAEHNGVDTAP
ncbi:hypothetical protein [Nannocystis bainbridge]|uniref:Uncharacterized protein n=1 Tax=Nannocystis bainbridge TaxID=2995303 RepID=A0ABT5E3A8_9BACT|nr:hypothetical protein [Nannocystis bainbridge]MDC0720355.1 hypothetical protein [Nannocystis bainbridge]